MPYSTSNKKIEDTFSTDTGTDTARGDIGHAYV